MIEQKKGFTLIELLVVVGIIGILATITIASLNSARAKARDAKRLSDVKQMATILESEEASTPGVALTGCVAVNADTTTCTGPGDVSEFSKFADPSAPTTACVSTASSTCKYSVTKITAGKAVAAATTGNYEICFYTEADKKLKKVSLGGLITDGCTAQ
jgi:prepilin-type N-terminal cleavage/methylation domain-containing protein